MEYCQKTNFCDPFFNFQKVLDNYDNTQVYIDNCHGTEFGLDLLAHKVSDSLLEKNLLHN